MELWEKVLTGSIISAMIGAYGGLIHIFRQFPKLEQDVKCLNTFMDTHKSITRECIEGLIQKENAQLREVLSLKMENLRASVEKNNEGSESYRKFYKETILQAVSDLKALKDKK